MEDRFIGYDDYGVMIGEQAMKVVTQAGDEARRLAELQAIEELSGYLRPKYNTRAIFSARGEARNALIVMYTCDVALYHLNASAPQRMNSDIREKRYERAIKWLEGVARGQIVPDLPTAESGEEGGDSNAGAGGGLRWGGDKKMTNYW